MLAYFTEADIIDRLTQHPFQPPSRVSSCVAEAGKLKSTFP